MTRTWSSGPRASVLPLRPLALVKKLAWIACPVCYPSLPHPISVQLHCLQGGGREVPPGKGVSSFLPHGAPTVGFALPVPTHLTRFPFWTLLSCHFPSLLPQWKLWGLQEPSFNPQRGMCVCVGGCSCPHVPIKSLGSFPGWRRDPFPLSRGERQGLCSEGKGGERMEVG